ncbi:MAG: SH3 domain-containing protein [Thermanaerothrix sp.]|nr:SH3 domain-containing protein [Thermanaerothrix sp.]
MSKPSLGVLIAAGISLGGLGFVALLVLMILLRTGSGTAVEVTAIYTVIPAPTATSLPDAFQAPTATTTIDPLLNPAGIRLGGYVQVYGTGGEGLRLRTKPGIDSAVMFLAMEEEVFQVLDGPVPADGYVWWYLQAPYDKNRSGWAAADFLKIVELTPQP